MKLIWPLLLSLGACGDLSPMAIAQLLTLSPMETDPAQLAVALELPEGVSLPAGSAYIHISAEQTELGKTSDQKYVLIANPDGDSRSIYRIAPKDLPLVRQQQALISGWKDDDEDSTHGSFSVGLTGCKVGEGPQPDGVVNISMRTSPEGAFVPLVRDMPWSDVVKKTDLAELPQC